jgi:putative transposase
MKKVRFTEEQTVAILREPDRSPIAEVARKHKIGRRTIYVWRRRIGKLEPADVKRLRELEAENAKLERMVAEREMAIRSLRTH